MTPELELVMTLRVEIAPPLVIGEVGGGLRRVIPITGGAFEGPQICGEVLPGGADWNSTRPGRRGRGLGALHAARRRRDADRDCQRRPGVVVPQPDGSRLARTVPQFEVAGDSTAGCAARRLCRHTSAPAEGGGGVRLQFFPRQLARPNPCRISANHNGCHIGFFLCRLAPCQPADLIWARFATQRGHRPQLR